MSELRWEAIAVALASLLSLVFVWNPGPYAMGAFTFIAQPLFVVAMASYAVKVFKDLRRKKLL